MVSFVKHGYKHSRNPFMTTFEIRAFVLFESITLNTHLICRATLLCLALRTGSVVFRTVLRLLPRFTKTKTMCSRYSLRVRVGEGYWSTDRVPCARRLIPECFGGHFGEGEVCRIQVLFPGVSVIAVDIIGDNVIGDNFW